MILGTNRKSTVTDMAGMSWRSWRGRFVLFHVLLAFASPAGAEAIRAPAAIHPFDPPGAPPDLEALFRPPGSQVDSKATSNISLGLQGPDGTWSVPFTHPAPRQLHCAVYDPVRKREIVFGGPNQPLDLIWTLSLDGRVQWSFFRVAGPVPIPRYGATAIYDPVRDRVLMFGGSLPPYPSSVATNEVWSLSLSGTPVWTRLEISGPAPSARYLHTAIYDSASDRMIIYAGGSWSSRLGDVWALDLSGAHGWTEIVAQTPAPPARREHAATYDAVHNRMIVFGGLGPGYLKDTWELSLSGTPAWRSIAEPGPDHCAGHSLIYDPIGDRAVMLGGLGSV